MGLFNAIKGSFNKAFKSKIEEIFNVTEVASADMQRAINTWVDIYKGRPYWAAPDEDGEQDIKTINFAKSICSETARLTNLALNVKFDGSRADYMANFTERSIMGRVREWVEYAAAYGTIILKPNGAGVDMITPDNFIITALDSNGDITGVVFQDNYIEGDKYYTRFEYHNKDAAGEYKIINKTYVSKSIRSLGDEIPIDLTRWASVAAEQYITRSNDTPLQGMLFGVLKMPAANSITLNSYMGMSIYADAVEELKDLDIAYTRNAAEIDASGRIIVMSDTLTMSRPILDERGNIFRRKIKLPKWIRNITGAETKDFYQEINPTLNTAVRIQGINNALSMVGYKCGYSNGYFVLDQKTGMVTATQVEADDRRTIQLIKDVRDKLKIAIDGLLYAQSIFADLYDLAPAGDYKTSYNFGDITYNYEEDKQTCWKYVTAGKYPLWLYYVRFEGMSEEEAKKIVEEVNAEQETRTAGGLFGIE